MQRRTGQRSRTECPRAGLVRFWLVFALFVTLTSCAQEPAQFVANFDLALASGDPAKVAQLLTPQSRPMFLAMQHIQPAPPPDPVTAVANEAGHAAFVPVAPSSPTRFVSARNDGAGIVFRVEADGEEREWAMEMNGGVWQLDLVATSSRSTFSGY